MNLIRALAVTVAFLGFGEPSFGVKLKSSAVPPPDCYMLLARAEFNLPPNSSNANLLEWSQLEHERLISKDLKKIKSLSPKEYQSHRSQVIAELIESFMNPAPSALGPYRSKSELQLFAEQHLKGQPANLSDESKLRILIRARLDLFKRGGGGQEIFSSIDELLTNFMITEAVRDNPKLEDYLRQQLARQKPMTKGEKATVAAIAAAVIQAAMCIAGSTELVPEQIPLYCLISYGTPTDEHDRFQVPR